MEPFFIRLQTGELFDPANGTLIKRMGDGWQWCRPEWVNLTQAEYDFIRDNYSKGPTQ